MRFSTSMPEGDPGVFIMIIFKSSSNKYYKGLQLHSDAFTSIQAYAALDLRTF